MTRAEILYLTPYFISLLISICILAYTWNKWRAHGANAFAWYVLGQTIWITGFIFELVSAEINIKIFWDRLQWFGGFFAIIALPVFAVQYTGLKLKSPRTLFRSLFIVPILFSLFLFSDQVFHWVYTNTRLTSDAPFAELLYEYTPVVYGYAIYAYAVTFWALYILVERIIQPRGLHRTQAALIALGISIPILGTVFSLLNIHITHQRDVIPFTSAIGNLIIAWSLFRSRLFDVAPTVREKVFEAMVEPVVILDNQNNIIDINTSMLALLGITSAEVIGKSAAEIFAEFPIPIKLFTHLSHGRTEATVELGGLNMHYELTVWPLYNSRKEMTGRIYISHDITTLKELENELRELNSELEDRVRARTWELAEAYDTTLEGWARTLELRDKETEGHSRRVTETTLKIATAMGINGDYLEHIRRGALLHDIGKMSIPDDILHKTDKLTEEERALVQNHPLTAFQLLSPIPFLKTALEIPYSHHEKWDGTGYPQGLKKHSIPMSARIFAVADVWDAVTTNRSYNKAWPREKAIAYFVEQSGIHFDPRVVNIFLELVERDEI